MTSDPTGRFVSVVRSSEHDMDLGQAAFLVAAHAHPGLDADAWVEQLDALASGCPERTLDGLRAYLFDELAFRGNTDDYDDPRNSFLNDVIERRTGIPISLSVLMMEVGRRLGLTIAGIGLPGHFVVRHIGVPAVMVDPFNGGRVLDRDECEALVMRLSNGQVRLDSSMLAPMGKHAIVARMLANLRHVYAVRGDNRSLAWVLRLRARMPDAGPAELAQLARVEAAVGQFKAAADALDQLADDGDASGPAADAARSQARLLRSRLN